MIMPYVQIKMDNILGFSKKVIKYIKKELLKCIRFDNNITIETNNTLKNSI